MARWKPVLSIDKYRGTKNGLGYPASPRICFSGVGVFLPSHAALLALAADYLRLFWKRMSPGS